MEESIYILRLSVLADGVYHGCLNKTPASTVANREKTICIANVGEAFIAASSGKSFKKRVEDRTKYGQNVSWTDAEVLDKLNEQNLSVFNIKVLFQFLKNIETKFNDEETTVNILGNPYLLLTNIDLPVDYVDGVPKYHNEIEIEVITWNGKRDISQVMTYTFSTSLHTNWLIQESVLTKEIEELIKAGKNL